MIKLEKEILDNLVLEAINEIEEVKKYDISDLEMIHKQIKDRNNDILYKIYIDSGTGLEIKYIGKSRGKYFKTRLKAHFKNIGKGTQSKYDFITHHISIGNKVYFKFIELSPCSLRNLIEEEIIKKSKMDGLELWNYKKLHTTTVNRQ